MDGFHFHLKWREPSVSKNARLLHLPQKGMNCLMRPLFRMSNDCQYGPYYHMFFCYWYGYMMIILYFFFSIVVYSIRRSYYIVSYWYVVTFALGADTLRGVIRRARTFAWISTVISDNWQWPGKELPGILYFWSAYFPQLVVFAFDIQVQNKKGHR